MALTLRGVRFRSGRGLLLGSTALPGVAPSTPAVSSGPMSQTFTLANWGNATSLGLHKRGVWFKKGDVAGNSVPVLSSGAAQFYGVTRWKDGSMKTARLLLQDNSIAAGASVSYTMTTATGSLPAGSTAAVGNAGLVSALSGHDFKMTFANVKTWDCASASGNYAALGSGAFTASLASHAATSTRWTVLTTGPVADVWQGWGMATDNSGGAADAHLKVNWYVTRWKNADGSTLSFQIGAVVALDWWSVANKYFLTYDAILADGSATIVSYPGVRHQYQSQWIACINDGSLNAGKAPWIGAPQPTLHCSFDRDYACGTGLIPPLDTSKRPTPAKQYAYIPCGTVADPSSDYPDSHRPPIDATGAYNGRGVVSRFDADALMAGTAQAYCVARLNALSGLGVPYHYRSNRTRTRPGESAADVANTPIVLLMRPKPANFSDFTAAGLPVAVDAYTANSTPGSAADGFVWQTGLQNPNVSGQPYKRDDIPAGAFGVWQPSIDASHAVSYCYFMALVSGDEWLLEAQIDLATNLAHQGIYGYHNYAQCFPKQAGWTSTAPADYWTGLLAQFQADAIRSLGWTQLLQGHATCLTPPDHPAYAYMQALMVHNGDYIGTNLDNLPADFFAAGFYSPESQLGLDSLFSPWMCGFQATGAYAHYLGNEDARWKRLGDLAATWTIRRAAAKQWYALNAYRTAHRRKRAAWDATGNPEIPAEQQVVLQLGGVTLDGSTSTFSVTQGSFWSSTGVCPPPLSNGDPVLFTSETDGGSGGVVPSGATEGQVAYIVGLANGDKLSGRQAPNPPPTFKLAASPGGAPLSFTTSTSNVNLGFLPQAASSYTVATASADYLAFPYMPDWGDYVPIHVSVIMMARMAGNTAATTAIRDGALAFSAPMDGNAMYYSAFDMATTV